MSFAGVAIVLAGEGATVVLHTPPVDCGAETGVEETKATGGKAIAIEADFRKHESFQRLADAALAYLGGIDVLLNNAGITYTAPFEETTPDQFDPLRYVNFRAPFFLTQTLVGALAEPGTPRVHPEHRWLPHNSTLSFAQVSML